MSTTLTNGLKLPDKGSVDWYVDMQNNYSILDGAVGTVAEHTTALSGKAPLVHTHTKSDITDFPVYGTTAGTICEGNDSRLSDARTPVAHTHITADVTDLLNSAHTWSGDNTFSGSNSFNSGLTINNAVLLNAVLQNAVKGDVSTTGDFAIFIKDKVNSNAATSLLAVYRGGQDSGGSYAQINIDTKGNDNSRYNNSILFRINPADNSNDAVLIPQRDKTIDLGTSTNKWKTINGINPGALSLPDISGADPIDFSQWDVSGAAWTNYYTPSENGWLRITITDRATNSIYVFNSDDISASAYGNGSQTSGGAGRLVLLMPVLSGVRYCIIIVANSISDIRKAEFIPCKGNV